MAYRLFQYYPYTFYPWTPGYGGPVGTIFEPAPGTFWNMISAFGDGFDIIGIKADGTLWTAAEWNTNVTVFELATAHNDWVYCGIIQNGSGLIAIRSNNELWSIGDGPRGPYNGVWTLIDTLPKAVKNVVECNYGNGVYIHYVDDTHAYYGANNAFWYQSYTPDAYDNAGNTPLTAINVVHPTATFSSVAWTVYAVDTDGTLYCAINPLHATQAGLTTLNTNVKSFNANGEAYAPAVYMKNDDSAWLLDTTEFGPNEVFNGYFWNPPPPLRFGSGTYLTVQGGSWDVLSAKSDGTVKITQWTRPVNGVPPVLVEGDMLSTTMVDDLAVYSAVGFGGAGFYMLAKGPSPDFWEKLQGSYQT